MLLFMGVKNKKKLKKGLVAWSREGNVVCVCVCKRGATSLTPHHLLPRLSEDRGRARSVGCTI